MEKQWECKGIDSLCVNLDTLIKALNFKGNHLSVDMLYGFDEFPPKAKGNALIFRFNRGKFAVLQYCPFCGGKMSCEA